MMRRTLVVGIAMLAGALCVYAGTGFHAAARTQQNKPETARLSGIKKIALAPAAVQIRFDQSKELPDPNRAAARFAAASRVSPLFETKLKGSHFELVPTEAVSLALRDLSLKSQDLYKIRREGSFDAPAEVVRNKKGDEAVLLCPRATMNETPTEVSGFRFKWHDLPDVETGLAAFHQEVYPKVDLATAKTVAERVGADSLMFIQVTDMEVHLGSTLVEPFRSVHLTLQGTLLGANDGEIVWQARQKGIVAQKAGFFTGARAYKAEDRAAIQAMDSALTKLVENLLEESRTAMGQAADRRTSSEDRRFYRRLPATPVDDNAANLRFDARLTDGSVAGELVLGQTTLEKALWIYSKPRSTTDIDPQMAAARKYPQVEAAIRKEAVGTIAQYTPWRSANTLFFDEDERLIGIAGPGDELEGKTMAQVLDRFPDLRETLRSSPRGDIYELRADAAPNLKLILVLDQRSEKVLATGYVYSGKTGD